VINNDDDDDDNNIKYDEVCVIIWTTQNLKSITPQCSMRYLVLPNKKYSQLLPHGSL
jgi:hypothetical protein